MSARPAVDVDVDKTGDVVTGRFTLKNLPTIDVAEAAKPLYAYVGVLDLALEQAKDVPAQVRSIPAQVRGIPTQVRSIPSQVRTIPAQVKSLRGDVETRVERVTERASDFYTQLTVRGERLVTSIRRSPATEAAVAEGKEAVRKAEASAIAARNSVRAGGKAVEDAAQKLG